MILKIKLEDLLKKREELVIEKQNLIIELSSLKIKKSVPHAAAKGRIVIEDSEFKERLKQRNTLANKIQIVENAFFEVNRDIKNLQKQINDIPDENTILKRMLKEVFSDAQMQEIYKELSNRRDGMPHTKLSLGIDNSINQKEEADKYKKIAKECVEKLLSARKILSSVLDEGMKQFDKGYFLKVMSPLNKSLPTLNEIDKIKTKNYL